jgi:hypothetical protein
VKEPVPEKERKKVNKLRNDLCPVREPVPEKEREEVNKLKNDLCPILNCRLRAVQTVG